MKAGDLVIMPKAAMANILRKDVMGVGLIVNGAIVRNRIGVMWSDGDNKVDYEPVKWLEVINES